MTLSPGEAVGLASLGRGKTSGIPNSGHCLESGIQARPPAHLSQGDRSLSWEEFMAEAGLGTGVALGLSA